MQLRLCALVVLGLATATVQPSSASEDWDWGDAATASWAIARENDYVLELHREASEAVEKATKETADKAEGRVTEHIASWLAPLEAAAADATAQGVTAEELDKCSFYFDFKYEINELKAAQPLCVVAGRTRWDLEVAKLKDVADDMLQQLVKAQDQSKRCAALGNELLQALCRLTKVTSIVLSVQDDKSKKAVTPYWNIINKAPASIAAETDACVERSFGRSEVNANANVKNGLSCIKQVIEEHHHQQQQQQ